MSTLRSNKLASWLLALAVFFAAMGVPALAAACEHPAGMQVSAPVAPEAAEMACAQSPEKACCCGPKDDQRRPAAHQPENHEAGSKIQAEQCHCSMSPAPDTTPADSKVVRLTVPVLVAYLPPAPFQIELPVQQPWIYAAPTVGPPGGPVRASAPSRAPPACL